VLDRPLAEDVGAVVKAGGADELADHMQLGHPFNGKAKAAVLISNSKMGFRDD
jgi:hypothetical protein